MRERVVPPQAFWTNGERWGASRERQATLDLLRHLSTGACPQAKAALLATFDLLQRNVHYEND